MIFGIIALIAVVILIILVYFLVKKAIWLILNSIIGFFALFGFNYLFGADIEINFFSVLITVIGGIFGFLIVLVAHFLGFAF